MRHHRSPDNRSYYEAEATLASRGPLSGLRLKLRSAFIDQLRSERRSSVVDFGAGPGRDGEGFVAAGLTTLGIDLAVGNGTLAARRGVTVIAGDICFPPLRSNSFEAGWSMSTLMHLSDNELVTATAAIAEVVAAGAPVWVSMWGGQYFVDAASITGQQRHFHGRSPEANASLLATHISVERVDVYQVEGRQERGEYQVFQLRTPGPAPP